MKISEKNKLNSTDTEHAEQSYVNVLSRPQKEANDFISRTFGDTVSAEQLEARRLFSSSKPQPQTSAAQVLDSIVNTDQSEKQPVQLLDILSQAKEAGRQIGTLVANRPPNSR